MIKTLATSDSKNYIKVVEKLLQVVRELSSSHDLQSVMDIVRYRVRSLISCDGVTFVLKDVDKCYYAEENAISPLWKGKRFPMKTCISGFAMKTKKPVIIKDIFVDGRIPLDIYEKTFVKSLAMVPIKTQEPLGAIGAYWADQHEATEDEIKVLQVIADTAAIALDNIHYQEIIINKAEALESAVSGTMMVIAKMVEKKDLYTSGHQRRVAKVARDIAKYLGWSDEVCDTIYRAGIVHDIGKIGIPSEILSKPASLSNHEYEIVKLHPESAYEMLVDIPTLEKEAQIVLQHHERLDGSGYPNKLKADEILPEAKIIAVADVFESMMSHRPYRPALGQEETLFELETYKGIKYCKEAVEAIVDMVRNKDYQI